MNAVVAVGLLLWAPLVAALQNGVALTPPMGWLSWERFACNTDCVHFPDTCISERLYRETIDRIVDDGWLKAGYEYVAIDDCWSLPERDANGDIMHDPKRFPSGIKFLADYAHERGVKLGLYADIGLYTCEGYPGLNVSVLAEGEREEDQRYYKDMQLFASWGIDALKVDGCFADRQYFHYTYPLLGRALNATGRPIMYSCSWPAYMGPYFADYEALSFYCNMWRNYVDIDDQWPAVVTIINYWGRNQTELVAAAGPGSWNDPDMLIIGNFGLSHSQMQVQMTMWAMFAAPLYMSNDLRDISADAVEILQNTEVIAVNQDRMGKQGYCVYATRSIQIWVRELADGTVAVAVLNLEHFAGPSLVSVGFRLVGLGEGLPEAAPLTVAVRDLVAHKDLGVFTDQWICKVNPTSVRMAKFRVVRDKTVAQGRGSSPTAAPTAVADTAVARPPWRNPLRRHQPKQSPKPMARSPAASPRPLSVVTRTHTPVAFRRQPTAAGSLARAAAAAAGSPLAGTAAATAQK